AAELVRLKADVILVGTTAAIRIVQRATATIPIVRAYSTDPVGNGFVASLARPGANITGLSSSSEDTSPKQLELVATVAPNVARIGLLGNPATPTYAETSLQRCRNRNGRRRKPQHVSAHGQGRDLEEAYVQAQDGPGRRPVQPDRSTRLPSFSSFD